MVLLLHMDLLPSFRHSGGHKFDRSLFPVMLLSCLGLGSRVFGFLFSRDCGLFWEFIILLLVPPRLFFFRIFGFVCFFGSGIGDFLTGGESSSELRRSRRIMRNLCVGERRVECVGFPAVAVGNASFIPSVQSFQHRDCGNKASGALNYNMPGSQQSD